MNTLIRPLVENIQPSIVSEYFDDENVFDHATLVRIIRTMCADVKSNFSEEVLLLLNKEDYDTLLDLDVSPSSYDNGTEYYLDAQIFAMIKKYPKWQTSYDPELQAKKTFLACEASCRDTNRRLWDHEERKTSWAVNSVLAIAQRKISNILGNVPSQDELPFKFGPGASYSVKNNTSALDKLASTLDATKDCYMYFDKYLNTCTGWRPSQSFDFVGPNQQREINLVKGDRLSFVPKTAKTHRPIGIGPLLNGTVQKGYGSVIRRKLRPYLDLNQTQVKHRELARNASVTGHLATIDLKAASDTIALALVQDLLPDQWFQALYACRSSQYTIENKWYPYQKFSAMGNGYTFELETLIFYCLSYSCTEYLNNEVSEVSVYGDDIIVPTAVAPLLREVLTYCGFSINEDKSFIDGPFRESCGGDYFNGQDVRPFYLKECVTFRTLFLFHNYMERTGHRFLFRKTFKLICKLIGPDTKNHFRTYNVLDDGALLDNTLPVCSYNRIVSYTKGSRRHKEVRSWGVSYGLYRLMIRYEPSETEDKLLYKTRNFRIKYRPYRHNHEVKLPLRNVALHAAHKVMDMDSRGVVPAREVRVDMATAATIQTHRHTQATTRGV